MSEPAPVVLVHGLFYGRLSMALLARRLRRAGLRTRSFAYRPTRDGLDAAARALARFAAADCTRPPHFVGHSFGGLVILRALELQHDRDPGRAVLLGSPLQGSRVARQLCRWRPGRALLGAAGPELVAGYDRIRSGWKVGLIAGNRSLGLGRLAGIRLGRSDGTVALDEVMAGDAADRDVLPVSHTGLLVSGRVAERVAAFLQNGRLRSLP
ncbi:alpha/beta fold hydrolase [Elongatibacter sediminis]|uniref:Alpha/beta fold hydrolase n=1 Tax=Elongatibacter sediminis TaxID=3119006 RepID=A0AAW9RFL1_9GAMM